MTSPLALSPDTYKKLEEKLPGIPGETFSILFIQNKQKSKNRRLQNDTYFSNIAKLGETATALGNMTNLRTTLISDAMDELVPHLACDIRHYMLNPEVYNMQCFAPSVLRTCVERVRS